MAGLIIRTCLPDPESRAEMLRKLRTEKPWQDVGGPGFDPRQLHNSDSIPGRLTGDFSHSSRGYSGKEQRKAGRIYGYINAACTSTTLTEAPHKPHETPRFVRQSPLQGITPDVTYLISVQVPPDETTLACSLLCSPRCRRQLARSVRTISWNPNVTLMPESAHVCLPVRLG